MLVEAAQVAELFAAAPAAWVAVAAGGGGALLFKHRHARRNQQKVLARALPRKTCGGGVRLMSADDVAALLANFEPLQAELSAIYDDLAAAGGQAPLQSFIERTEDAILDMERLCRYLTGLNLAFADPDDKAAFNGVIASHRAWAARLRRVVEQWVE